MNYGSLKDKRLITALHYIAGSKDWKDNDNYSGGYIYYFKELWSILDKYIKPESLNFKLEVISTVFNYVFLSITYRDSEETIAYKLDDLFLHYVYSTVSDKMSDFEKVKFYEVASHELIQKGEYEKIKSLPIDTKIGILFLKKYMYTIGTDKSKLEKAFAYKGGDTLNVLVGGTVISFKLTKSIPLELFVYYMPSLNICILSSFGKMLYVFEGSRLIQISDNLTYKGKHSISDTTVFKRRIIMSGSDIPCFYKEVNESDYVHENI